MIDVHSGRIRIWEKVGMRSPHWEGGPGVVGRGSVYKVEGVPPMTPTQRTYSLFWRDDDEEHGMCKDKSVFCWTFWDSKMLERRISGVVNCILRKYSSCCAACCFHVLWLFVTLVVPPTPPLPGPPPHPCRGPHPTPAGPPTPPLQGGPLPPPHHFLPRGEPPFPPLLSPSPSPPIPLPQGGRYPPFSAPSFLPGAYFRSFPWSPRLFPRGPHFFPGALPQSWHIIFASQIEKLRTQSPLGCYSWAVDRRTPLFAYWLEPFLTSTNCNKDCWYPTEIPREHSFPLLLFSIVRGPHLGLNFSGFAPVFRVRAFFYCCCEQHIFVAVDYFKLFVLFLLCLFCFCHVLWTLIRRLLTNDICRLKDVIRHGVRGQRIGEVQCPRRFWMANWIGRSFAPRGSFPGHEDACEHLRILFERCSRLHESGASEISAVDVG